MKRIPYPSIDKNNEDIYGEELNYYIDTISNVKESFNNSDKSSEILNNINSRQYIPNSKNSNQKYSKDNIIYRNMNSKDKYIKSLEQKVKQQKEQILKLMDYKNLCEEKLKEMNPLISLPLQKNINFNNDIFINKFNSNNEQPNKKTLNLSYNQNHINSKSNQRKNNKSFKINRANSELDINNISNSGEDKYDKLYSKYIKIINDFKNLSNNSVSTNEYTRLKTQYNDLKNKNNNLLKQIQDKTNNDMEEKDLINKLKEQVKTFREELVLSQAMVNSLRSELEHYNKNNKKSGRSKSTYNNDLNYNDIESSDRINIKYNNMDNDILKEENENLKLSLKNNNILLSKVLEENNKLRENNYGKMYKNIDTQNNEEENIDIIKNNLIQYENKFDYFNDYINNIKNKINMIFNDIKNILYKIDNPQNNRKYSENLIRKINNLKKDIYSIKNIDRFNLDSKDDEDCLNIYMNIVKLLLNELEQNKPKIYNNYQNNTYDKTKNYLKDILNILKEKIYENSIKQLISDALNILNNLDELYQIQNKNSLNGYKNINKKILEQEKELDYIKTLLLNHKKENRNKNLTYSMNYNSPKIEMHRNKSALYFEYE